MDGKCVRLTQGKKDSAEIYFHNPAEAAIRWQREGAELLHVVDLDGAFAGEMQNRAALERIVQTVSIPVQFGGGVRSVEAIERLLEAGADRVILGTIAVERRTRTFWAPTCHIPT